MVPEADFKNSISTESVKVMIFVLHFQFGLCIGFKKKFSKHKSELIRRVVKIKSSLVRPLLKVKIVGLFRQPSTVVSQKIGDQAEGRPTYI